MEQHPQLSATVTKEIYDEVAKLAQKENRSISSMVFVLLQSAIKEKNRKKKSTAKENHS